MQHYPYKKKSNDFWVAYMSYYVFVLLIPLVAAVTIYTAGLFFLHQEAIKTNRIILAQTAQRMDSEWSELKHFGESFFVDNTFLNILWTDGELSAQQRYSASEFSTTYQTYQAMNPLIQDSWLFLIDRKETLNRKGIVSFSEMNPYFFAEYYWNDTTNKAFLDKQYKSDLCTIPSNAESFSRELLFFHSASPTGGYDIHSLFVARVNPVELENLSIVQTKELKMFAVVKDDTQELLYVNDSALWESVQQDILTRKDNNGLIKNGKYDTIYYRIKSQTLPCTYYGLIDANMLDESMRGITILALVVFVLVLISTLWLFRMIRLRRYDPLSGTVALLSGDNRMIDADNAFSFIQKMVSEMVANNATVQNSMQESRLYLRNYFLGRLLTHKIENSQKYIDLLDYHQLKFPYEKFILVLLYAESNIPVDHQSEDITSIVRNQLQTSLESIGGELQRPHVCGMYLNGLQILIVNCNKALLLQGLVLQIVDSYCEIFAQYEIVAAISNEKESILGLSEAYDEAMQALDQALLHGGVLVQYSEKSQEHHLSSGQYQQYEFNLVQALEHQEFEAAKIILNNLLLLAQREEVQNVNLTRCRIYGIANVLINSLESVIAPELHETFIEQLTKKQGIDHLKKVAFDLFDSLSLDTKTDVSMHLIVQDVKDYVAVNIGDQNLSVSGIADYFKMELPLLSKSFTKQTGQNLSKYINIERMKLAKERLLHSNYTIKEIAEECGYLNSGVFIRVFRRYEGITPGKYREGMLNL